MCCEDLKKQWKATELLILDSRTANLIAEDVAEKQGLSQKEKANFAMHVEAAQESVNAIGAVFAVYGLWKLGKGVYKLVKWRRRNR